MMIYIDYIKYRTMHDDPDQLIDKVVNCDIIHHDCRGNKVIGNHKDYKTIKNEGLYRYLKGEAKVVLSAALRNKREDLWVTRDLKIKHFKENFK